MSSSSYLELLKSKQAKLLKVLDLFESGVGERSEFVNKILCGSYKVCFRHSNDAGLKLSFIRDLKLECPNKRLIKLIDSFCGTYSLCSPLDCGYKTRPVYGHDTTRHQRIHHGDEKPFKCRDCKYSTNWKQSLKEHQLRTHSRSTGCKKVFVCEFEGCNFRTSLKYLTAEHRRRHLNIKPFKCHHPDCGLSFVSKSCLQQHKIAHEKKRFRCMQNNCKFATKRRSSLKLHQATHSSVRAFRCPHENCTYAGKQRYNLLQHLQTHSEAKPYKCDFYGCSYATKYKRTLPNHILTHEDVKQFKCHFKHCNYAGRTKHRLRAHQVVHSEVRQFKCDYENCNFSTKHKHNLKTHNFIHSKCRPFKCDYKNCSFAAIQKRHLVRHERIHERKRRAKGKK